MQLWKFAFKRREKIGVVLEGKFAVQPADDMQLGRAFVHGVACDIQSLLEPNACKRLLPRSAIKPAELAVRDADIRVIEMPVDVVIRRQAVFLASDRVGEFAERVQIGRVIKSDAFIKRKTLAVFDLKAQFHADSDRMKTA